MPLWMCRKMGSKRVKVRLENVEEVKWDNEVIIINNKKGPNSTKKKAMDILLTPSICQKKESVQLSLTEEVVVWGYYWRQSLTLKS